MKILHYVVLLLLLSYAITVTAQHDEHEHAEEKTEKDEKHEKVRMLRVYSAD